MDTSRIDQTPTRRERSGKIKEVTRSIKRIRGRRSNARSSVQPNASRGTFSSPKSTARQVNFEFFDPKATSVFVAGSFNNWDAQTSPLRNVGAGEWCLQILLQPGRYEYRFLVDGQCRRDPTARQQVTDFCGGVNSVLVVE